MTAPRPNILFVMTDDHAAHAMSCYGSRINSTPNLDRIAAAGMRFSNCFCTNSICEPSRATILTGTHTHVNRVTTIGAHLDNRLDNVAKILQRHGYQTAVIGKWHLGHGPLHDPAGFDHWNVLQGQGPYVDPEMIRDGTKTQYRGYTTDIITDLSLEWLEQRDRQRPFFLMYHHKAPHRPWEPDARHAALYEGMDLPEPQTFNDDYATRAEAARAATMRVDRDLNALDLKLRYDSPAARHTPLAPPPSLEGYTLTTQDGQIVSFPTYEALKSWKYQRYIKDYLRCVASVDDNVGRVLDYLDDRGLAEDTIVIYTSDQGFFLGDHGWYDKRFMYEESLRMPFLIRYPRLIRPGQVCDDMILNLDFAPTWLDVAGVDIPDWMQGRSFRPLLEGTRPADWRTAMYYRYWMHLAHHNVYAHYGIRTLRHKLIYYYADALGQPGTIAGNRPPEWELFDLQEDPCELQNRYADPACAPTVRYLKSELHRLQSEAGDTRYPLDTD